MANLVIHYINTSFMIELTHFCRADKDIENCRRKLEHEVFRHDWFVAWFDREGAPFYKLPLFNTGFFKEALRRFYVEANDFINRFGFIGFYHIKDIDTWMLQVAALQEGDEGEDGEMEVDVDHDRTLKENIMADFPFGVIPLGMSERDSYGQYMVIENRSNMQKKLIFECLEEAVAKRYAFTVVDYGAQFQSMPYCGGNVNLGNFGEDYIPLSPFTELRRQKRLVLEGETALFDANSMHVYPENIAYVKPQKDAPLEEMTDDNLYAIDNILQGRQKDNYNRQDMALDDARCQIQRNAMKRTINCVTRKSCGNIQIQAPSRIILDHKQANNRPSLYEMTQTLPAPIEISGNKPGQPFVNVAERERKYENDVCTVMRLPYVFFKPHGSSTDTKSSSSGTGSTNRSSLGSGNTSHNDMYQKLLEAEVSAQHERFSDLLKEVYYHTFRKLDRQLFYESGQPSIFSGIEVGVQFDHNIVKSDEALVGLVKFYEAGIVPGDVIRRLVYKNFSIPLLEGDEQADIIPIDKKRRKLDVIPVLNDEELLLV